MIWKSLIAVIVVLALVVGVSLQTRSTARVEHTLPAPVAKVWTTWNDPESMKQWWGPDGYSAPVVKNDLKVGGKYLLAMKSPGGEVSYNAGTYTEVVEHQKIVSDLVFSDENGNALAGNQIPVPGNWPDTVKMTVLFKDLDGTRTHVSITEEGIPLIMKLFAQLGWKQQFGKLEKILAQ